MPVYAYIAPVIGDGLSMDTAYRLSIAGSAGPNSRYYIPSNSNGTPKFAWGFGLVSGDAATHNAIQSMANVTQLPKFAPSTLLKDIPAATRNAAQTKMTSMGIDYSMLTLNNTYRDMLALIVKTLEPKAAANEVDDMTT